LGVSDVSDSRFPDLTTLLVVIAVIVMPICIPTTLAVQIVVFATATLSVSLLLGSAGLLSFGQGLYLGVGSYATGILLRDFGFGLAPTLVLATLAGTLVAGLLAILIVRRRGIYFVMLTLAFAQMGYFAMLAAKDTTGGENGMTGLPRSFHIAGVTVASHLSLYVLAATGFLLAFLVVQRISTSPFGSVLTAIRENESRSEALGYDVRLFKIAIFAVAGGIAGLSGAMHVVSLGFVPPNDIEPEISQRILLMAIIGGVGSPAGALVGTIFYTIVAEALSALWARWMALIALVLISIVLFLPGGLWSIGERLAMLRKGRKADG
jgi:branched-chain amino acid transport system permease protein